MLLHKPLISFLNVRVSVVCCCWWHCHCCRCRCRCYTVNVNVAQIPTVYLSFVGEHIVFLFSRWFRNKNETKRGKKWHSACDGHTRVRLRSIYCFSPLHQINSRSRRPTNQIFNNSVHVCSRWFRFRFVSFSFFCPSLVGAPVSFAASVRFFFVRRFSSLASIRLKCALRT